ncbi:MAG: nitrite/sulfite reductase [Actinomycetes bacterium]
MPADRRGRPKGQGQWAMGHREPLNKNEQVKKDDDGLNVRQRIESIYQYRGFDAIDPADLRNRMRWWGLYTQRAPGIDGGKTAILEPEELDDKFFMMRIRIPGGQLTSHQLRTIADVATVYGRDVADITDRQNIQLHWIRIEDVPAIWKAIESVGLSTAQACGDTPRNMLGCPLTGIAADEVIDAGPVLAATDGRWLLDKSFSNLPRKYKTAISGCSRHCTAHEINDISFVGVVGPNGTPGFDLWVGGGLSTNPILAVRLGAFVEADQVPDVWSGVTSVFRDYGYRRQRNRARLKFLVSDWGAEKFREVLEKEYLGFALPDGPAPEPPPDGLRDHVGVTAQKDGLFAVGAALQSGRTSGGVLKQVADLADRFGQGRVRTTVEQKLVLLDIAESHVDTVASELAALDMEVRPTAFRRGMMACTGLEFCKLAIVETKARAVWLTDELERRMPDWQEPISINVNGCPNSCARFQLADFGLKGSLVPGPNGEPVPGYQIHLGGHLGIESGFGRKLRGLKVMAEDLPDYIERVLTRYRAGRTPEETFAVWAARADEADLQ